MNWINVNSNISKDGWVIQNNTWRIENNVENIIKTYRRCATYICIMKVETYIRRLRYIDDYMIYIIV
jgi:hypothetical protein